MSGCATPEVSTREVCTHPMHVQCMERFIVEKDIAEGIKKEFDKRHGPTWHCVVGRHFGECKYLRAAARALEHVIVAAQHKLHDIAYRRPCTELQ